MVAWKASTIVHVYSGTGHMIVQECLHHFHPHYWDFPSFRISVLSLTQSKRKLTFLFSSIHSFLLRNWKYFVLITTVSYPRVYTPSLLSAVPSGQRKKQSFNLPNRKMNTPEKPPCKTYCMLNGINDYFKIMTF